MLNKFFYVLFALSFVSSAAALSCYFHDEFPCTYGGAEGCTFDKKLSGVLERTGSCCCNDDTFCLRYQVADNKNVSTFQECLPGEQLPEGQFCSCSWPPVFWDSSGVKAGAVLRLTDRGINSIKADAFKDMAQLENLNLYMNNLSSLPAGLFDTNIALKFINLQFNKLQSLPANLFEKNSALK